MIKHYCDKCGKEMDVGVTVTTEPVGKVYEYSKKEGCNVMDICDKYSEEMEFCMSCWKGMKPWHS